MDFSLSDILNVSYRGVLSLLVLFLVTRIIGKRQVSQLSLFDYVIGISIGNFAAEMTTNFETNELIGAVAVIIFGFIAYAVSFITMKSKRLRTYITGTPVVLIDRGIIITENFRKTKYDLDDLMEVCRSKGYFDIDEIYYAIMEVNGDISFLPKVKYKPVTVGDLNLSIKQDYLVANIIMDGKIIEGNLNNMGKTKKWLEHELKVKGINKDNILLATLTIDDKINIYPRDNQKEAVNVIE